MGAENENKTILKQKILMKNLGWLEFVKGLNLISFS